MGARCQGSRPAGRAACLESAEAALSAELDRLRAAITAVRAVLQDGAAVSGDEPLLTVEQAARHLHASRSRVFELLAAGELEGVRVGRSRCVPRRSIEEFLGRQGAA
jgi:excisionase family DNA binding protein